ncbi:MAG: hypothetical protein KGY46_10870, partial [Anaerolineales bacterium]|nr:hypothetical protein [Anaerolineales bacterium]
MDKIRNYIEHGLESPPIMAVVGLVFGILLGLLYGWVIDPVEWEDTTVSQLRDDLKVEYLRMAIDSYALNQDAALAEQRYERLGEDAQ